MKNIVILGSTGSIGTQTLDVVRAIGDVKVVAITTNVQIDILLRQIIEFCPQYAVICDYNKYLEFIDYYSGDTNILYGIDGILEIVSLSHVDMVINSLVGNIGLAPTIKAIEMGKDIGLANKETLVTAGEIIMKMASDYSVEIYPIDSEHSAIFQCLQGNEHNKIDKIFLTASGGPFRKKTHEELLSVTVEDALNHPNWVMGSKITIDSATLMNKGLEVIEAKWLFDVDANDIVVVVHPESIIHSMVMFTDSSVISQMGMPDMKVPIQYALYYPHRRRNDFPKLDLFSTNKLTFEKPNTANFPCLTLAYEALKIGGLMPTVLNGANEVAVSLFLNRKIKFLDIYTLIHNTMNAYINISCDFTLDNIYEIDKWSREYALTHSATLLNKDSIHFAL